MPYVMICYDIKFRILITHECILQHIAGASNYEGGKVGLRTTEDNNNNNGNKKGRAVVQ
jgi:hypothetical protein